MNNFFEIFYFNGHKYLFDGNTVEVLEVPIDFNVNEYMRLENLQINSHRYNYLKTICLVLNNSCNLSCDYCFANKGKYDKPNEQMKFEDAQNALCHLISTVKKK